MKKIIIIFVSMQVFWFGAKGVFSLGVKALSTKKTLNLMQKIVKVKNNNNVSYSKLIKKIPTELWIEIFTFLSLKDIGSLYLTATEYNKIINNSDYLWKILMLRKISNWKNKRWRNLLKDLKDRKDIVWKDVYRFIMLDKANNIKFITKNNFDKWETFIFWQMVLLNRKPDDTFKKNLNEKINKYKKESKENSVLQDLLSNNLSKNHYIIKSTDNEKKIEQKRLLKLYLLQNCSYSFLWHFWDNSKWDIGLWILKNPKGYTCQVLKSIWTTSHATGPDNIKTQTWNIGLWILKNPKGYSDWILNLIWEDCSYYVNNIKTQTFDIGLWILKNPKGYSDNFLQKILYDCWHNAQRKTWDILKNPKGYSNEFLQKIWHYFLKDVKANEIERQSWDIVLWILKNPKGYSDEFLQEIWHDCWKYGVLDNKNYIVKVLKNIFYVCWDTKLDNMKTKIWKIVLWILKNPKDYSDEFLQKIWHDCWHNAPDNIKTQTIKTLNVLCNKAKAQNIELHVTDDINNMYLAEHEISKIIKAQRNLSESA